MWPLNMLRYVIVPGVQFIWHGFAYVRYAVYFGLGFCSAPALRFVWNWIRPDQSISIPQAMAVVFTGLGTAIFVTKTEAGNDVLGGLSALLIIVGCTGWLVIAAIPALCLLAFSPKPRAEERSLAARFYFGPLNWADRQFFLNRRAGN